jgi:hypothetical protein
MRKAMLSLDAIMAILLLLFILLWGQSIVLSDFNKANSFGTNYEAKAEAIRAGSVMNTFISTKPKAGDYATLAPSDARAFSDSSESMTIEKTGVSGLSVVFSSRFGAASSVYPVAVQALISGGKITSA